MEAGLGMPLLSSTLSDTSSLFDSFRRRRALLGHTDQPCSNERTNPNRVAVDDLPCLPSAATKELGFCLVIGPDQVVYFLEEFKDPVSSRSRYLVAIRVRFRRHSI